MTLTVFEIKAFFQDEDTNRYPDSEIFIIVYHILYHIYIYHMDGED